MKYVIAATMIVNDIYAADGSEIKGIIGGGIYCVGGIKPFENDVGYVATAGTDYEAHYGKYFDDNGIGRAGVITRLPHTRYTVVKYHPDGRWREDYIYGDDYVKQIAGLADLAGNDVAQFCSGQTKAIYTESGVAEPFWSEASLKKIRAAAPNAKLLWEVPTDDTLSEAARPDVLRVAKLCDMFSVNLPEGKDLFGKQTEQEVIDAIIAFGVPCFFRCGTKGAYMIMNGEATFAPTVGLADSVDPTGCGNCSTAAAMYGFAEGHSPLRIVVQANVAAYYNALQAGPYPVFTPELQAKIAQQVEEILNELQ